MYIYKQYINNIFIVTPNKITFTLTRKKKTSTRFFPRPKRSSPTFLQRWTAAKPTPPAALWIRTSLRHGMEEEGRVDPFPMGFPMGFQWFPSRIHWKTHLTSQEFGRRTRWRKFSNWFTDEGHKRCLLLRQIRQFSVSGTLTGPDSCHPVQGQPCCSVSTGAFKDSRSAGMKNNKSPESPELPELPESQLSFPLCPACDGFFWAHGLRGFGHHLGICHQVRTSVPK